METMDVLSAEGPPELQRFLAWIRICCRFPTIPMRERVGDRIPRMGSTAKCEFHSAKLEKRDKGL